MDPIPREVITIDLKNIFISQVKEEFPPLVGIIFVLVSVRGQRAERCEEEGWSYRRKREWPLTPRGENLFKKKAENRANVRSAAQVALG